MARLRSNFQRGSLSANISNSATTISSGQFNTLPVVAAPDYLMIVLDPDAQHGNPEIVKVTAHTSSATSVTATRAQEGTSARSHNSSTVWRHVPSAADWAAVRTTATDAVLYVSADSSASDNNDGLSWGSAKATIQAAVTALPATGGTVQVGAGTFSHTTTIDIPSYVTIEGVGWVRPTVTGKATIVSFTGTGYAFRASDVVHPGLRNLKVVTNSPALGALEIKEVVGGSNFGTWENLTFYGWTTGSSTRGLYIHGEVSSCAFHSFRNFQISNFATGIKLSGFANSNYFENGWLQSLNQALDLSNDGTDTKGGSTNLFVRLEFAGSVVNGINISGDASGGRENVFIKCTEDGVTTVGLVDAGPNNVYIGCNFLDTGWSVTGANHLFLNCTGVPTGYSFRFPTLEVASSITINGNQLTNVTRDVSVASIKDATGASTLFTTATDRVKAGKRVIFGDQAVLASASSAAVPTGSNFVFVTGTTTMNNITGGENGQILVLQFGGSLTVTNNAAGAGKFRLAGAANFSATANDTLTLINDGSDWYEVARAAI